MKKSLLNLFTIIMVGLSISGCNKAAHDVQPLYVSSYRYENKTCDSLKQELEYVQERVNIMVQRVDERKSSQDTKLAFGWLFWPSYIIIDNNEPEAQELGKLRGEQNALKSVYETKKCKEEI